jgi:hypothetical protein
MLCLQQGWKKLSVENVATSSWAQNTRIFKVEKKQLCEQKIRSSPPPTEKLRRTFPKSLVTLYHFPGLEHSDPPHCTGGSGHSCVLSVSSHPLPSLPHLLGLTHIHLGVRSSGWSHLPSTWEELMQPFLFPQEHMPGYTAPFHLCRHFLHGLSCPGLGTESSLFMVSTRKTAGDAH